MFWHTTEELEALAAFRAERKLKEELTQDLADFQEIFWHPTHPEQKVWAKKMLESIKHELDQLNS